jgi:Ala-tRNA(Pro) deacylase
MTAFSKIKNFLEKSEVSFQSLEHPIAYTSLEIASAQHLPGRQVVKSVIVFVDGQFIMCILPAIHYLDLDKLKATIGAKDIRLAHEDELSKLFPDVELGAEPPFGHFYGLKVIVDKILEEDEEIAFNAGTHTDMIQMKFGDFKRLSQCTSADIGVHIKKGR